MDMWYYVEVCLKNQFSYFILSSFHLARALSSVVFNVLLASLVAIDLKVGEVLNILQRFLRSILTTETSFIGCV